MKKVIIKRLPKAQTGMNFTTPGANTVFPITVNTDSQYGSAADTAVNKTLKPVDKNYANLEAEKGETAVTTLDKNGIPEFYKIGGKRHYDGGTPLNLPEDSFIFSRDKKMLIKDPDVLAQFGKNVKGKNKGFSPADLSKKYDLNKYHLILADPDSDMMSRKTAELMITNYNNKLGALALVQESQKGFDNGIPAISMPYIENIGLDLMSVANPMKQEMANQQPEFKEGGSFNKRKVRITLPTYPQGGEPVSQKSTGSQNIPSTATKWDSSQGPIDQSKVKPGDYIKKDDGKWYKVTGRAQKDYGFSDPRLGNLQTAYGHLNNTISSNEDLQNTIYANYQKHIKNANLSEAEKEELLKADPKTVIKTFLEGQKQVYALNDSGALYEKNEDGSFKLDADGKRMMKSEKDLKTWETRESEQYRNTVKNLGFEDSEIFSPLQTAMFQAAYKGLQDASTDDKYKETLGNFNLTPVGLKDSHGKHTYAGKPISPVDKYFGNTTAGQAALPKSLDEELIMQEAETPAEPEIPANPEIGHLQPKVENEYAPWWLQDIIATAGAAGDFGRVQKFSPWQATPGTYVPNPTFLDPTRQLAANAEAASIATQGAGVFAGPQAFNARSSQIQGQAANNVANTLASVHQGNVSIANQFETQKAQILNTASDRKAQLATSLYDKNTIANQQFANEKNMARQAIRQNYINAITNRTQTQVMNSMYPQYRIDPATGGFMSYTGRERPITPKQSSPNTMMDRISEYKHLYPGLDDATYLQAAKADMGVKDDNPFAGFDPAMFAYPVR